MLITPPQRSRLPADKPIADFIQPRTRACPQLVRALQSTQTAKELVSPESELALPQKRRRLNNEETRSRQQVATLAR